MAREVHSADTKIDQLPPVVTDDDRGGDTIIVERVINKEYADELAFNQEPVTIRLEPSSDENAPTTFPVWCNGKPAEVLLASGRWQEIGYLPVSCEITVRRSTVAIIAASKLTRIRTASDTASEEERLANKAHRHTSAAHAFSVIADSNPRGGPWLSELIRRNM